MAVYMTKRTTCAVFTLWCICSLCSATRIKIKLKTKNIKHESTEPGENSSLCSPDHDADRSVVFYGGGFDPITVAHVAVAKAALAQEPIDCVWMSPIYHPKYKPDKADAVLRETMISTSFSDEFQDRIKMSCAYEQSYEDGMGVQTMDIKAYTWLETKYPQTKVDMVVGADSLTPDGPYTVEGWRDILRAVARKKNQIFVLMRDDLGIEEYENMLCEKWEVSPNPFIHVDVNMSAFSKVSSSRIRKLMSETTDGKIDNDIRKKLHEAGLSDPLLDYLEENPSVVSNYASKGVKKDSGGMRANIFMAIYVGVFLLQQLVN